MNVCLIILLYLIDAVYQLEIAASYTTSFQCRNGSYALIGGANLTLKYNYGYNHSEVHSFHLYEMLKGRHMFDFESAAGQAFIKDNRLKAYNWTNTGIKFNIPSINKEIHLGKYEGEVDIGPDYKANSIHIKQIFDPPPEVKITTPIGIDAYVNLNKGFGKYVFEASAEPYTAINCSSVMVIWSSPTKENVDSCQGEDETEPTLCPLTITESEMTADECMTLEVYAEQYGVRSENKTYTVCYSSSVPDIQVITGGATGVFILVVIIVIILVVCWYKKCKKQENGKVKYSAASNDIYC